MVFARFAIIRPLARIIGRISQSVLGHMHRLHAIELDGLVRETQVEAPCLQVAVKPLRTLHGDSASQDGVPGPRISRQQYLLKLF